MVYFVDVRPTRGDPFRLLASRRETALQTGRALSPVVDDVRVTESADDGTETVIFHESAGPANELIVFD